MVDARLTLGVLGALVASSCGLGGPGTFERVVVQRDLLESIADWRVEGQSSLGVPSLGVLTPSYSAKYDSGDLPSILVPPGSRVSFEFPETDAPAILRCAAGVDLSVPRSLNPQAKPLRVQFQAHLDGKTVLDIVVPVHPTPPGKQTAKNPQTWHWVNGQAEGLPVNGGQELTLSTRLLGPARPGLENVRIGFGGLVTETSVTTERTTSSPERPNIVLFVVDTERADRTSTHGYDKPTTPHLDRLVGRGLRFDDAWVTAPWTWPATASILTGLEPLSHGVTSHESCYLGHRVPSLPKLLQERGFTTAGFSCNPLIVADKNFDAGFEHFETTPDFTPGSEVMPRVHEWVREHAEERFFLYVHLVDPHDPHRPLPSELARLGGSKPSEYPKGGYRMFGGRLRKKVIEVGPNGYDHRDFVTPAESAWVGDVYDACVATADVHLGGMIDLLGELELMEETVIAYTSDHGEELLDHGLTNHAHTLHPELMHVPLVIAGPGIPAGGVRHQRVSNRHLATTLALLGGGDLGVADGKNLVSADLVAEPELFFQTTKGIWNDWSMVEIFGLLEEDWSFHWAPQGLPFRTLPGTDPGEGQWRLYDRRNDPHELRDVAAAHPDVAERMQARLRAWRLERESSRAVFGVGAETRSLLEGVGYIELEGAEQDE